MIEAACHGPNTHLVKAAADRPKPTYVVHVRSTELSELVLTPALQKPILPEDQSVRKTLPYEVDRFKVQFDWIGDNIVLFVFLLRDCLLEILRQI